MEPTYPLTPADADVAYHALRYYASELFESFVADDESPMLEEAALAEGLAGKLQVWLVTNRQALARDDAPAATGVAEETTGEGTSR